MRDFIHVLLIIIPILGCSEDRLEETQNHSETLVNQSNDMINVTVGDTFDFSRLSQVTGLWWQMKLDPKYVEELALTNVNFGSQEWGEHILISNLTVGYPPNNPGLYLDFEDPQRISVESLLSGEPLIPYLSSLFKSDIHLIQENENTFEITSDSATLVLRIISENIIQVSVQNEGRFLALGSGMFATQQNTEGFELFYRVAGPGKPYVIWEDGTFNPIKDYENYTRGMQESIEN